MTKDFLAFANLLSSKEWEHDWEIEWNEYLDALHNKQSRMKNGYPANINDSKDVHRMMFILRKYHEWVNKEEPQEPNHQ